MTAAAWIIFWWFLAALIVGLLFGAIARAGRGAEKED